MYRPRREWAWDDQAEQAYIEVVKDDDGQWVEAE